MLYISQNSTFTTKAYKTTLEIKNIIQNNFNYFISKFFVKFQENKINGNINKVKELLEESCNKSKWHL
ncbi:hypothetical protein C1645_835327 [Glomus cerebriforme]|uniref:Uncharacterized protein n=1 Tax=Glomus cerebriforme TaxID=658196 RepID=A0A397SI40_9GLOM|nr:hypothetical protein C1645_835327 [Glomus cerebriforme]